MRLLKIILSNPSLPGAAIVLMLLELWCGHDLCQCFCAALLSSGFPFVWYHAEVVRVCVCVRFPSFAHSWISSFHRLPPFPPYSDVDFEYVCTADKQRHTDKGRHKLGVVLVSGGTRAWTTPGCLV